MNPEKYFIRTQASLKILQSKVSQVGETVAGCVWEVSCQRFPESRSSAALPEYLVSSPQLPTDGIRGWEASGRQGVSEENGLLGGGVIGMGVEA